MAVHLTKKQPACFVSIMFPVPLNQSFGRHFEFFHCPGTGALAANPPPFSLEGQKAGGKPVMTCVFQVRFVELDNYQV